MAGGLLQLVAYGAQDQFLTGDPTITFFKAVYRQHTNFAMEFILQTLQGNIGKGKRVTSTIARHGDLLLDTWILIKTDDTSSIDMADVPNIIDTIELEIGGQRIDLHYGYWLLGWYNLTNSKEKINALHPHIDGYNRRAKIPITNYESFADKNGISIDEVPLAGSLISSELDYFRKTRNLYVPLQFFFCNNPGLALPLIALQYHEVKINITFTNKKLVDENITDVELYSNYVYLDVDERRRFAQTSHQMLIEQVQTHIEYISGKEKNKKITLNFNHPIKELILGTDHASRDFIFDRKRYNEDYDKVEHFYGVYKNQYSHIHYDSLRLLLNGQERFSPQPPEYFTQIQPYKYHTCGNLQEYPMHVYSFAIHPEDHQPSGTCNFSRIDNVVLEFQGDVYINQFKDTEYMKDPSGFPYFLFSTFTPVVNDDGNYQGVLETSENPNDFGFLEGNIIVFAKNYNILRITSGMGGLAFSN